ncbi:MAG: ATP-binding protein [Candidatus Limnocylindria bacterium]
MVRRSRTESPIRGRERELGLLTEMIAAVNEGRGSVGTIEGTAGLGKSRLLDEAGRVAEAAHVAVFRGTAEELDRVAPLASILAALRSGQDPILPAQDVLALPLSADARLLLAQELRDRIERRASSGSLLVILEDLQWADPATLFMLRSLTSGLAAEPVLWLFSIQPSSEPSEAALAVEDWVNGGGTRITLRPLGPASALQIATDIYGGELDAALRRLVEEALGDPLLIVELVRGFTGGDDDKPVLSRSFADIVERRLGVLSAETRQLLRVGAVLGRAFTLSDAAVLLGRSAVECVPLIAEAIVAGILVDEGTGLVFQHDLVRHVVYDELGSAARSGVHREAARTLVASGHPAVEVAAHLEFGAAFGDVEAAQGLEDAARALAGISVHTSARLAKRSLDITAADDPDRARRAVLVVRAVVTAGDAPEAIAIAERELAGKRGRQDDGTLWFELANATFLTTRYVDSAAITRRALRRRGITAANRASLEVLGAFSAALYLPPREARARIEKAQLAADGFETATARAQTRLALAIVELFSGRLDQALQQLRGSAGADILLAYDLGALDRLEEALEVLDALNRDVGASGSAQNRAAVLVARAHVLFAIGRLDEAAAEAEAASQVGRELDLVLEEVGALDIAYRIGVRRGLEATVDRRWAHLRPLLAEAQAQNYGLDTGALLAGSSSSGREATVARFDRVMPSLDHRHYLLAVTPSVGPQLVTVALGMGDRDRAARIVDRAEKLASANPGVVSLVAAAAHARGLLDDDIPVLQHAHEVAISSPRPLLRADIAHSLGNALAMIGQRADAVAVWQEAVATYDSCGATLDSAMVRDRLRAAGVRGAADHRRRPSEGWTALTESELAVVRLVAEGRTNREVARRLFLSPHTVDSHLRHAFRKLRVSSRVELTRIAIETDQPPAD